MCKDIYSGKHKIGCIPTIYIFVTLMFALNIQVLLEVFPSLQQLSMEVVCSVLNMCELFTMIWGELYKKTYGDILRRYELHCDVIAMIELAHY